MDDTSRKFVNQLRLFRLSATDSVLVVELRRLAAIEYDLEVATTKRAAAVLRESTARLFQSRAETKIKIKDTEVATPSRPG